MGKTRCRPPDGDAGVFNDAAVHGVHETVTRQAGNDDSQTQLESGDRRSRKHRHDGQAWLRLQRDRSAAAPGLTQGLALAAQAMRCVLVDRGRHQKSQKRGGRLPHVKLDDLLHAARTAPVIVGPAAEMDVDGASGGRAAHYGNGYR
jgi:hypothetical protein